MKMNSLKMLIKCFGVVEKKEEKEDDCGGKEEYRWEEIEGAIRRGRVVGRGGYSTVYEAAGTAVKMVYGRRVFEDELDTLRRVGHHPHPNIVKLIGYARHHSDDQMAALVLEYAPNGTVEDKIETLGWHSRVRIAFHVARAIDHLHHRCGPLPIVHGDLKPSNVLLDRRLNPLLCDLGSARTGFSSSASHSRGITMTGSPGYTDPHFLRTAIPSKKNDVYSFGVLLLHLVRGATPFTGPTGQLFPFPPALDPRLASNYDPHEADQIIALAARCLSHPPALRPCSSHLPLAISSACRSTSLASSSN